MRLAGGVLGRHPPAAHAGGGQRGGRRGPDKRGAAVTVEDVQ